MYYIHIYCSNIICHWHWLDNTICIQVLDFYKRLSKALDGNPTIASADDMRTDGGELKKVCVDFCCCWSSPYLAISCHILQYLAGHFESVQGDFWKCKSGSRPKPKWNQGPQIHKYTTEIQLRSTLSLKRQFLKIRWRSRRMECSRTKWTTRFGTGWM